MTAETETARAASRRSPTGSYHGGAAGEGAGGVTAVYKVTGMTCGHCEGAVSEEVSGIEGVTSVKAVASTGRVTVTSAGPLAVDAVRAAVDEAGYELVGQV